MKTLLKWIRRMALALLVLVLLGVGVIYALSERSLRAVGDVAEDAVPLPTDSASLAEGERLARLRGCYDGCHGEGYAGGVFFEPGGVLNHLFGRVVAPDLTRMAATLSDTEFERVVRHGIRPNGRNVAIMPSNMFQHLSDEDYARIVAHIRSSPPSEGPETSVRLGPIARWFMATGVFPSVAETVDNGKPHPARTPTEPAELGRYLALTVCVECHGDRLEGVDTTPPLAVATGYTREQFGRLMATGVPAGGQELELMKEVAVRRFVHFTETEVDALYAFLSTRTDVGDLELHPVDGS